LEKIESLEGKHIAIIGLGASQIDYVIGVENSKTWDEVWGINSALSVFDVDRVFMLDPVSRFLDTEDAGNQTDVMRRVLPKYTKPIYTCELDERVPALVEYPLEEVIEDQRCAYMNNTTAYALAFALWNRVGQIDLFGMDFSYKHHRLDNPKIAMPTPADEWMVCDRSDLAKMVKKHKLETVELPSAPEPYKG
jgi:hypothetical protein